MASRTTQVTRRRWRSLKLESQVGAVDNTSSTREAGRAEIVDGASQAGISKRRRGLSSGEYSNTTPAKAARTASLPQHTKNAKPVMPSEPPKPPSSIVLFARDRWPNLAGKKKDRLQQAESLWKTLPANDKAAYESKVEASMEVYTSEKKEYRKQLAAYKKSLSPDERAALKQKEQDEALRQKSCAKECREALKSLGEQLRGNLKTYRIASKISGAWTAPSGILYASNIDLQKFKFIFGALSSKFMRDWTAEAPTVVGTLTGVDAGNVFGTSNIKGGSLYAKFVVSQIIVTYEPNKATLTMDYKTKETC